MHEQQTLDIGILEGILHIEVLLCWLKYLGLSAPGLWNSLRRLQFQMRWLSGDPEGADSWKLFAD